TALVATSWTTACARFYEAARARTLRRLRRGARLRRRRVGLGVEAPHLGLDPALDLAHQVVSVAAAAVDRVADRDVDRARLEQEAAARPATRRRDSDRHDRDATAHCEAAGPALVGALRAARRACALWKHDDPHALGHQARALVGHLGPGLGALAAVDVDHVEPAHRPTEE